ncbi:MAG TPA: hypothetical protein VFS08_09390 [Gemmatimonadaceae bacterium]|nr:hypothetical protein [Gemmatimonadaceae bacterium]
MSHERRATQARGRRDLPVAAVVAAWLVLALVLDVGVGLWPQRALGAATWLLLLALLRAEDRAVRGQVAVVVVLATLVEYTASPLLGFYVYRLGNVPAFVPPGHGLVYLAALALGRSAPFTRYGRPICRSALLAGGAWALWGVTLAPRGDTLGLLLYLLFAAFVLTGRAPLVYAGAFLVTGALELTGTMLGTWAWAPHGPGGFLAIGNPPSGIAGGYCVFDAAALAVGGWGATSGIAARPRRRPAVAGRIRDGRGVQRRASGVPGRRAVSVE